MTGTKIVAQLFSPIKRGVNLNSVFIQNSILKILFMNLRQFDKSITNKFSNQQTSIDFNLKSKEISLKSINLLFQISPN